MVVVELELVVDSTADWLNEETSVWLPFKLLIGNYFPI